MGSISISKKSNSALFIVKAKDNIKNLIDIFNGKIYIKKKQIQFEKWISNYNNKYKYDIKTKNWNYQPYRCWRFFYGICNKKKNEGQTYEKEEFKSIIKWILWRI